MLGPGLMRTAPGVLRNVGSEGEDVAPSLPPAGAGVALDREAARALPRGRPRPRVGAILRPDVDVGVEVGSFGNVDVSCCRKSWVGGYLQSRLEFDAFS